MSGLGAPCVTIGPTVRTLQGAIVSGSSQSDEQSFGDVFEEARASSRASASGEPASGPDPSTSAPTATARSTAPATPAPGAAQADDEPSLWQPRAGTRASKADGPDTEETPAVVPGPGLGLDRTTGPRQELEGTGRRHRVVPRLERLRLHVHGLSILCHVRFGRRRCGDSRSGRGFGDGSAGPPDGRLRERNRGGLGCLDARRRSRRDRGREPGIVRHGPGRGRRRDDATPAGSMARRLSGAAGAAAMAIATAQASGQVARPARVVSGSAATAAPAEAQPARQGGQAAVAAAGPTASSATASETASQVTASASADASSGAALASALAQPIAGRPARRLASGAAGAPVGSEGQVVTAARPAFDRAPGPDPHPPAAARSFECDAGALHTARGYSLPRPPFRQLSRPRPLHRPAPCRFARPRHRRSRPPPRSALPPRRRCFASRLRRRLRERLRGRLPPSRRSRQRCRPPPNSIRRAAEAAQAERLANRARRSIHGYHLFGAGRRPSPCSSSARIGRQTTGRGLERGQPCVRRGFRHGLPPCRAIRCRARPP